MCTSISSPFMILKYCQCRAMVSSYSLGENEPIIFIVLVALVVQHVGTLYPVFRMRLKPGSHATVLHIKHAKEPNVSTKCVSASDPYSPSPSRTPGSTHPRSSIQSTTATTFSSDHKTMKV